MKKLVSIIFAAILLPAMAQNGYENILKEIESNNMTLIASREQSEAQKLANRTGIFLENPEVEFNYLWGSPSIVGNRIDFSVTQSFDFPSAYSHRNKISKMKNEHIKLQYKAERIEILLRAKQLTIETIYYNALLNQYVVRLENAERISASYKTRLEKGDANRLESNKAILNVISVENEIKRLEVERNSCLSQLRSLNGGKDISISNREFLLTALPVNFEQWYREAEAKSPVLQYLSEQIEINQQQIKLNRSMGAPKFTAGYTSEWVLGQNYQGIAAGISIPLWENKNNVKYAKVQATASELILQDTKIQFYNQLQNQYAKAAGLQQTAQEYKIALSLYNNETLLQKALDVGEISLLEYLLEIEYYYSIVNNVLETERDFELSIAELFAIEL